MCIINNNKFNCKLAIDAYLFYRNFMFNTFKISNLITVFYNFKNDHKVSGKRTTSIIQNINLLNKLKKNATKANTQKLKIISINRYDD